MASKRCSNLTSLYSLRMVGVYVGKGYALSGMVKLNVVNEQSVLSAYLTKSHDLWHGRLVKKL